MSQRGVAWDPYGYYRTKSNIAQFLDEYDYDSYAETRPDSEDELARFWDAAVEDTGLVWETPYEKVLDTSNGYPFAK
ncbi:acetyl-coenzyme A synthetase N-terminal domain-containing protein [Natrinema sp. DC36]|uniref:acetyl-coenzyme A synthetase N-terminal domain-containing protein n=1 Tax=Natrinema sp. DC36 TaxID=2878680 RepID=UPI001CF0517D|nr:acetyl-coenzyme A synthetase N-terminal domain-containing protein [Natrinema sp. DC36]